MVFVAVRPDGRSMDTALPVDDPTGDKISLAPGASLTGEINLEWVIRDLRRATRESDVLLFWAYEAPEELCIAHWSGGFVVIPRKKLEYGLV